MLQNLIVRSLLIDFYCYFIEFQLAKKLTTVKKNTGEIMTTYYDTEPVEEDLTKYIDCSVKVMAYRSSIDEADWSLLQHAYAPVIFENGSPRRDDREGHLGTDGNGNDIFVSWIEGWKNKKIDAFRIIDESGNEIKAVGDNISLERMRQENKSRYAV